MQKQKSSLLILAAIVVLSLAAPLYLLQQNKSVSKLSNIINDQPNFPKNTPTQAPEIFISLTPISVPTVSEGNLTTFSGIFTIIYGDPKDGGKPRYKYSVTDSQGKTISLKFVNDTKYIGGNNPSDYRGKNVNVAGNFVSNIMEVLSISLE